MRIILTATLFLILSSGYIGQNKKFTKEMKATILLFDSAKTETDYLKAISGFKKAGKQEKNNWLVNYYTGLCYILLAMEKKGDDVDLYSDTADVNIRKADSLSPNNSEIYVLKSMAASLRVMADPMSRAMQYGKMSYDANQKAITLNANNPRPYLTKGQSVFYTPEAFNGGAEKAKPYLQKAVDRYKIFKPETEIHPNWGNQMAEQLLKECNEILK